jgi:hypothetical protein
MGKFLTERAGVKKLLSDPKISQELRGSLGIKGKKIYRQ